MQSSEDILKQIENVTNGLPEEGVESITSEWPRTKKVEALTYESSEDEVADYYEGKARLEDEWRSSEMERMQSEYARTGQVPRAMNFDEWQTHREIVEPQQKMANALQTDIEDLVERYPKSSAGFLKKLRRGEIQLPEELEAEDNALEQWFINSISEDEFRRMPPDAQRELFNKEDEERKPLRTRSLDVVIPKRVRPKPQPRRQQTYALPDVTQEDFQEMFSDWMRKHPEKMGRR